MFEDDAFLYRRPPLRLIRPVIDSRKAHLSPVSWKNNRKIGYEREGEGGRGAERNKLKIYLRDA